ENTKRERATCTFSLIVTPALITSALAQSRTCLWASPEPRNGEARAGNLGVTNPVGSAANHRSEDALKQRRCGPCWTQVVHMPVSSEAHPHCRQCGRVSPPS